MRKYVYLDDNNRIATIQDCALFPDEALEDKAFDFPEGFVFGTEHEYRFVGGELVHDPLPVPDAAPTPEERIAALEADNAELREVIEIILAGGAV